MEDFDQLQMPTNSVRIYAEKLSTNFIKDLQGNHSKQIPLRSKVKQIKDHADQLLKRSKIKKINFEKIKDQKIKGQQSSKVKDQKKLNSDQEVNFQKVQRSKVQRSDQVFELSSKKTGAVHTMFTKQLFLETFNFLKYFKLIKCRRIKTFSFLHVLMYFRAIQ